MNTIFKLTLTLFLFFSFNSSSYATENQEFNGNYQSDLVVLNVKHTIVYTVTKDKKTGKMIKEKSQKTMFSIADKFKKNLLYLALVVDGKSYIWKNLFDYKGANDLSHTFSVDGFPKDVTLKVSNSYGQISRPFNRNYKLRLKLDLSSIKEGQKKGKILIREVK